MKYFVVCVTAMLATAMAGGTQPPRSATGHTVTKATVDAWMVQLSNWGRWGKDDQKGAINLSDACSAETSAGRSA